MVRRRTAAVAAALGALALSACSELAFRQDERFRFTAPADASASTLPLDIRWTAQPLAPGESYAVFVDRTLPEPGMSLRSLFAERDQACRATPSCPDDTYLAALNVYVTSGTSVVVRQVEHAGSKGTKRIHRAAVIRLDSQRRRVGEAAWSLTFTVKS